MEITSVLMILAGVLFLVIVVLAFVYLKVSANEKTGNTKPSSLNKTYSKTKALSADVDAAYNPNFSYAFEKIIQDILEKE